MSNAASFTEKKLIISLPEARKLMGKDAKGLNDEELEKLIIDFTAIAKLYFKSVPG
jgi:hypothetical protein